MTAASPCDVIAVISASVISQVALIHLFLLQGYKLFRDVFVGWLALRIRFLMSVCAHLLWCCMFALGLGHESYFGQWNSSNFDFSRGLDILLYFVFLSFLLMFTGTCLGLPAGGREVSWHRATLS